MSLRWSYGHSTCAALLNAPSPHVPSAHFCPNLQALFEAEGPRHDPSGAGDTERWQLAALGVGDEQWWLAGSHIALQLPRWAGRDLLQPGAQLVADGFPPPGVMHISLDCQAFPSPGVVHQL